MALLAAARRLADARDPLGIEARVRLPEATGLSAAGVELGLTRHLECEISSENMTKLLERAGDAPRVHVVLSANVFVGALRAMALAVAAAPSVHVRASTREAVMAPLLCRALDEAGSDAGDERRDGSSTSPPARGTRCMRTAAPRPSQRSGLAGIHREGTRSWPWLRYRSHRCYERR